MTRALVLVLAFGLGELGAQSQRTTPPRGRSGRVIQLERGDLPSNRSAAVGVVTLQAEPTQLALFVGDSVSLDRIVRIIALDSVGRPLGRLRLFDSSFEGDAVTWEGDSVFGLRKGVSWLIVSFPRRLWHGREGDPPAVRIKASVSDRSKKEPLRPTRQ